MASEHNGLNAAAHDLRARIRETDAFWLEATRRARQPRAYSNEGFGWIRAVDLAVRRRHAAADRGLWRP